MRLLGLAATAAATAGMSWQRWGSAAGWSLAAMAVLIAGLAWLASVEFRAPCVLRIGPDGIDGHGTRGRTVAWADVAGWRTAYMPRAGEMLVLALRPGAPALRIGFGTPAPVLRQRLLSLDALGAADRRRVREAMRLHCGPSQGSGDNPAPCASASPRCRARATTSSCWTRPPAR